MGTQPGDTRTRDALLRERQRRILQLEGQLAKCENEKYQLERRVAERVQTDRRRERRAKQHKTKKAKV